MTRPLRIHYQSANSGFTLVEVVIASVLVCLLAFCAYRGVTTVHGAARASADRVAAMGLCIAKLERIRSLAYEEVNSSNPACQEETTTLNRLPGFGEGRELKAKLSVDPIDDGEILAHRSPAWKGVTVRCKWTFMGRNREENLSAYIVDGYNTYADIVELNGVVLDISYYPAPSVFYVIGKDGEMFDESTLEDMAHKGKIPAVAIVFRPGGTGEQTFQSQGKEYRVNSEKTSTVSCSNTEDPIWIQIEKKSDRYRMTLNCEKASYSAR